VGINIRPVALAAAAPTPAAAVAIAPGCLHDLDASLDAPEALLRIVPALVQAVQAFAQFGFAPFQPRFALRDVLDGRAVQLSDGAQGTAHGVGDSGALQVLTASGMVQVTSAEVSVRPVAGAGARSARPC
jgi:BirA family biotin operon repressor/biotin-[acetyl-CoA-carboxylase] ligase